MLAAIKRFFSTDKSETSVLNQVLRQNEVLSANLFEALKVSQSLNLHQSETLDRIVAYRFDPPAHTRSIEQPTNPYNFDSLDDAMSIEDDAEFLAATQR